MKNVFIYQNLVIIISFKLENTIFNDLLANNIEIKKNKKCLKKNIIK